MQRHSLKANHLNQFDVDAIQSLHGNEELPTPLQIYIRTGGQFGRNMPVIDPATDQQITLAQWFAHSLTLANQRTEEILSNVFTRA